MALILDTNAFSALAESDRVLERLIGSHALHIPAIVLGEFLFGIAGSRHQRRLKSWIDLEGGLWRILAAGERTARFYAVRVELKRKGRPIADNDLWIAALAREHGLPIVTRDTDFLAVDNVEVLHW